MYYNLLFFNLSKTVFWSFRHFLGETGCKSTAIFWTAKIILRFLRFFWLFSLFCYLEIAKWGSNARASVYNINIRRAEVAELCKKNRIYLHEPKYCCTFAGEKS